MLFFFQLSILCEFGSNSQAQLNLYFARKKKPTTNWTNKMRRYCEKKETTRRIVWMLLKATDWDKKIGKEFFLPGKLIISFFGPSKTKANERRTTVFVNRSNKTRRKNCSLSHRKSWREEKSTINDGMSLGCTLLKCNSGRSYEEEKTHTHTFIENQEFAANSDFHSNWNSKYSVNW